MLISSLDLIMRWSVQHSAPHMTWVVRTSCLKPVLHLEDGVCNDQLVLCTEGEESESVVVHFRHSMLANNFTPNQVLRTHSSIEISHEYEPLRRRCFL